MPNNPKKEYQRVYYQQHKEQAKERSIVWQREHKEQVKEYKRKYDQKHKAQTKERSRRWYREHSKQGKLRKFGLTYDTFNQMLAEQDRLCAICGRPETTISHKSGKTQDLSIDHDHTTGKVRSLLCTKCNTLLGYADDNPDILIAAAAYLRGWKNSAVEPALTSEEC